MIWEDIESRAETILSQSWVRWIHDGTLPAKTSEQKERNLFIGMTTKHCAVCLNLNGCCFVKKKAPNAPFRIAIAESLKFLLSSLRQSARLRSSRHIFLMKAKAVEKKTCLNLGDMVSLIRKTWPKNISNRQNRRTCRAYIYWADWMHTVNVSTS